MSKKYKQKWLSASILIAGLAGASALALAQSPNGPQGQGPNQFHLPPQHYPDLFVYCEMANSELGFINPETDEIITEELDLPCQHAWVLPDGKTIYASVDALDLDTPAEVLVIEVKDINWANGSADIEIVKTLDLGVLESPWDRTIYEDLVHTWWFPEFTQGHGPSFLPQSHYSYLTEWNSNRIRVIDTRTHELVEGLDPIDDPAVARGLHPHGINFNHSGTRGLGTGYFFDLNTIEVYKPNKQTGELSYEGSIELKDETGASAAFTHYTFWLNNRYALTATMQPSGVSEAEIGPSVWLLDAVQQTAEKIIGTADSAADEGIFRPASDLVVANYKLYVAEEDSLRDDAFGEDGYVSIFDISDVHHPEFIKRLGPGDGIIPSDFAIAHGAGVTPDERFVYIASYASGYILKIDTETDEVVAVFDDSPMPHGGFLPGNAGDSSFAHPPRK